MSQVSLVLICLSTVCSADLFTDDGIHINRAGSSRIIESLWTAVVVINPPPMIPMQAWVEEVHSGIQTVGSCMTAENQKIWETRLEALLSLGPQVEVCRVVLKDHLREAEDVWRGTSGHRRRSRQGSLWGSYSERHDRYTPCREGGGKGHGDNVP